MKIRYFLFLVVAGLMCTSKVYSQSDTTQAFSDSITNAFVQQQKKIAQAKLDSTIDASIGYPVSPFFKDTLFMVFHKIGSFTAEQRAKEIGKRIKSLSEEFDFLADSLIIDSTKFTTDLIYKGDIIVSISDDDAVWARTGRSDLGNQYKEIIASSVSFQQKELSLFGILKKVGLGILVLIILIVFIKLINKAFKWASVKVAEQENRLIKGIKIRNYTLYDAKSQVNVLLKITTFLKWVLIVITVYSSLPALFGIFPWTKNLADTLLGFILDPLKGIALGLWDYLPNLFTIAVVVVVFRYVLKLIKYLKKEIARGALKIPGFFPDWANPTYQIIRVLVIAFMIVVIFPYLPGSDSPIFKGVSVFLGFLFTFGSAGSLSNIISGLVLTYMRLYRRGDRIRIGEITGDVIEKTMLVTRVRTIKNEIISIPNSTVMNSHTINYSSVAKEKGLIIHTSVTIGYDVPWKEVHEALIDAATRTENIMKEPAPFVLQTSLDDFYVAYQLNAHTHEANKQAAIYSEIHQNIQDCFNEKGIEILSPHYRGVRDGNESTIPKNYLPDDYLPPFFRVNSSDDKKSS